MVADGLTNGEHVYSEGEGTKDGTLRITAHNSIISNNCGWMGTRSVAWLLEI